MPTVMIETGVFDVLSNQKLSSIVYCSKIGEDAVNKRYILFVSGFGFQI